MSQSLNSTQLVKSIKRRGFIPSNQRTFDTDDFLEVSTEQLLIKILPEILERYEDHYTFSEDTSLVASQSNYTIPYRAIGGRLKDVKYVDTNGEEHELTKIDLAEKDNFKHSESLTYFFFKNNEIVFMPDVSSTVTGSIRFYYYMMPSKLVQTSRAGEITAIDTDTGVVTLSSVPSHFTTSLEYDFVQKKAPHKIRAIDKTASSVDTSNKTITFTAADLPSNLAVGDYVMQAQETIYPQLMPELHALLAQETAVFCLEALGDLDSLQRAEKTLKTMREGLITLIENRAEGAPTKAVNHHGLIRKYNRYVVR